MANITEDGIDPGRNDANSLRHTLPANVAIFLSALNISLSITASVGNALILVALQKVPSIYPPTKLLFRCLAVTDLCVGVILQPFYATYLMCFIPNMKGDLINIVAVLPVANFSTALLFEVSVFTSTAISVDRLLVLSLGMRYRHAVTLRRVRTVIASFWLIGVLNGSLVFFTRFDVFLKVFLFLNILSVITTIFSYTKIFLTLRHHQAERQGIPPNIARYKRTVTTIAWVQLAIVFCYTPYSIVQLLVFRGKIYAAAKSIIYCTLSLVYLNSSLNPFLYCWKIRNVRQQVKNTIRQVCSF